MPLPKRELFCLSKAIIETIKEINPYSANLPTFIGHKGGSFVRNCLTRVPKETKAILTKPFTLYSDAELNILGQRLFGVLYNPSVTNVTQQEKKFAAAFTHLPSDIYRKDNVFSENAGMRALKFQAGGCTQLCNLVMTFLKITKIPAARGTFVSYCFTGKHDFLVIHNDFHIFYKGKVDISFGFDKLLRIFRSPAVICDPWISAFSMVDTLGLKHHRNAIIKSRTESFYDTEKTYIEYTVPLSDLFFSESKSRLKDTGRGQENNELRYNHHLQTFIKKQNIFYRKYGYFIKHYDALFALYRQESNQVIKVAKKGQTNSNSTSTYDKLYDML